jgi:hypothetical protein
MTTGRREVLGARDGQGRTRQHVARDGLPLRGACRLATQLARRHPRRVTWRQWSKRRLRAAVVMATTQGWLMRRSTEIA